MAYILLLLIMAIFMRALFDRWKPFHLLLFRFLLPLLLTWAAVPVAAQEALPTVRVGVLKFGTVNWELDVIEARKLTKKYGFNLKVVALASGDASNLRSPRTRRFTCVGRPRIRTRAHISPSARSATP
jgi:hypothetical protein